MINIINNENIIEALTIVLCNRDYTHIGQLTNVSNIKYTGNLNSADELSFVINKIADDNEEQFWDQIYNLKLVWIKELNEYFEIQVSIDDNTYLQKTITATSLCEAELSQTILHNIEINTEADISRDDYDVKFPTIFYRDLHDYVGDEYVKARNSSLMHRILDKVPAYSIKHVDASLANLQRTFSIDGTSIYDWLTGECSEQFNCLFVFNSTDRTIEVYDLYSNCNNCSHRGNFVDVCPECGSTNIKEGYGEDTEIFCSTENLTDKIKFTTDTNSIKNCFRLVAGDDDMTAAIININPNGSQYIYNFSDESLMDMPQELVDKISLYNELYQEYVYTREYTLNQLPTKEIGIFLYDFNNLISKYHDSFYAARNKNLIQIPVYPNSFTGYANLIKYIYEGYELQSYLQSGMMPASYTHGVVNASTEVEKINRGDMGYEISLTSFSHATSVKTVESAILNYAKVFVKTGYVKLKVNTNSFINNSTYGTWTGYITVSNYSDDNDVVDSIVFSMTVNDDYSSFMQQKIAKQIVNSTKEENDSIYNVLNPNNTLNDFKTALTYYSLARIESFKDALNAVLSVLQEANQATPGSELYVSQYLQYYRKFEAANQEYNIRALECELCEETLEVLLQFKAGIQDELNFKKYLDPDDSTHYYELFTTYVREDDYNNDNYISEGLDNDQLFDKAQEFYAAATEELIKSSNHQHSISSNLYNLLLLDEFKPLKYKFELGNWIRIKIDNNIYRLRLISYSVDFDNLLNLSTEFSNLTKTANGLNDVKSVIKQASNMATSYNAVTKQSESGQVANNYLDTMIVDGLSTVNSKLKNNNNEEMTITAAGIIGKSYDDITETFSPKQVRLTHNILAFTTDNWETVETALGEITYTNASGTTVTDYGLIAKVVISGYIYGSTIDSGNIISGHIQNRDNSIYIDLDNDQNFIKCLNNLTVDKYGRIKTTNGLFTNFSNSNYINLSGNYDAYNLSGTIDAEGYVDSIEINTNIIDINTEETVNINITNPLNITSSVGSATLYNRYNYQEETISLFCGGNYFTTKITKNTGIYRILINNNLSQELSYDIYVNNVNANIVNFGNNFIVDNGGNITAKTINIDNTFCNSIKTEDFFGGKRLIRVASYDVPTNGHFLSSIYYGTPNTYVRVVINEETNNRKPVSLEYQYPPDTQIIQERITIKKGKNIFNKVFNPGEKININLYFYGNDEERCYGDVYLEVYDVSIQEYQYGHLLSSPKLFFESSTNIDNFRPSTTKYGYDIDPNNGLINSYRIDSDANYNGIYIQGGKIFYQNNHTVPKITLDNSGSYTQDSYGNYVPVLGSGNYYLEIDAYNISSGIRGSVQWNGSDIRLKDNINDLSIEKSLYLINNVRPVEYELKEYPGIKRYGFIAQELREILDNNSGIEFDSGDKNNTRSINYNDFIAPLCLIVKDQQKQIDELKKMLKH